MVFFDGEADDEMFAEINEADAAVGITELDAMDFHRVQAVYFKMFAQKHGSWEETFK